MGFDRVRFFEGCGETPATLISADKQTSLVVYGKPFLDFLSILGHRAYIGFDEAVQMPTQDIKTRLELGRQPIPYPESAKKIWFGHPYASEYVTVIEPPLDKDDTRRAMRFIERYAEPSDAGPLYLDHRGEHEGCTINFRTGTAVPHAELAAQMLAQAKHIQDRATTPADQALLPPPLT